MKYSSAETFEKICYKKIFSLSVSMLLLFTMLSFPTIAFQQETSPSIGDDIVTGYESNGEEADGGFLLGEGEPTNIIYVDDNANPSWYDGTHVHTIQEGIDSASDGYTIYVYSGTYSENVEANKSVILQGENKDTTIIDAGGSESAVFITASSVTVKGFTLQNSRFDDPQADPGLPAAIVCSSTNHATIMDNIITNNDLGIYCLASSYNTITKNTIRDNEMGVKLQYLNIGEKFYSKNNVLYLNNFINNNNQAYNSGSNTWYNSTLMQGNYWDNFDESSEGAWDNNSDCIVDSPYTITGSVQDLHPLLYEDGWCNYKPNTPSRPSGPASGYINITYTFETSTTDPDGNNVAYLFDWGDGNQSSWTTFKSSGATASGSHSWQTEDTYNIKVKAKDIYGKESGWSSVSTVTIEIPPLPELEIDAPSSVTEGNDFTITVTSDSVPIDGATVLFLGVTYHTNSNGIVTLTAPLIESHTDYPISADHDGYVTAFAMVTILNVEEQPQPESPVGWITGKVRDASGEAIIGASVSIKLTDGTTIKAYCDKNGYRILVPVGTYTVTASKPGYGSSTKYDITINSNEVTEEDFTLVKIQDFKQESSGNEDSDVIEAAITAGVSADKIGGELNVESIDQNYSVVVYKEGLNIKNVSVSISELTFIIGAEGVSDTILALRLYGQEDFSDISVEYDGDPIERVGFTDIFNLIGSNSSAAYTRILAEGENGSVMYCLVYIPHFSEHEITIFSVYAEIVQHTEIVIAIGSIVIIIAAVVMFRKGKEEE